MEHLWITQTGMKTIPTLWITEKLVSLCMSAKMIPMVSQVTPGGTPTATLHWAYYARLLLKMGHSLLHHYLHDLQIFHVMRERVRSGSRVVRKTPGVMHSMASVTTMSDTLGDKPEITVAVKEEGWPPFIISMKITLYSQRYLNTYNFSLWSNV